MRIISIFILLLCLACSGIKSYVVTDVQRINPEPKSDSLNIDYIGCGGFLLTKDHSSIMLDPYFSNLSPFPLLPFKKLKPDERAIDTFFYQNFNHIKDTAGNLKSILIAHSHYDHLADVPSIYSRNCNPDSTQIIGSKTTHHILKGAGIKSISISSQTDKEKEQQVNKPQGDEFMYTQNRRIRILPILSEHAPHLLGMKFISSKKLAKDLESFPKKALKLPEGENYNFLIDFLDEEGHISFRVFSHAGSAANAKIGFPPQNVLSEKKVDVLLLCVASFSQVKNYPDSIIKFLKPKHIVLNHWENFFKPSHKLQKRLTKVPGTNVKKFIRNLEKICADSIGFTLPAPLTELVFYP